LKFNANFFKDVSEENSKEFIENRIKAKKELIKLLEINPKTKINVDDVILYKKSAILYLNLKPKTKYNIKFN
jgi:hypothetical protein